MRKDSREKDENLELAFDSKVSFILSLFFSFFLCVRGARVI